jgi:hypothetical protein
MRSSLGWGVVLCIAVVASIPSLWQAVIITKSRSLMADMGVRLEAVEQTTADVNQLLGVRNFTIRTRRDHTERVGFVLIAQVGERTERSFVGSIVGVGKETDVRVVMRGRLLQDSVLDLRFIHEGTVLATEIRNPFLSCTGVSIADPEQSDGLLAFGDISTDDLAEQVSQEVSLRVAEGELVQ